MVTKPIPPASPASPASPAPAPAAASPARGLLLNVLKPEFLTDPDSPFPDKYSIAKEEVFLADFIVSGRDESDPLYDRYIELIDRKEQFDKMRSAHKSTLGADRLVEQNEVDKIRFIGNLVGEEDDTVEIHTKEGGRLFMGRRPEPGGDGTRFIIGGRRIGAVLRSLWMLTARDNPYADWALLRHEHSMTEVRARLDREIAAAEELIADQRKLGIHLSVLKSSDPAEFTLGFRSPYGFITATFIRRFDYFVLLQKTLERKGLRSDLQVRQSIYEITRIVRRVWEDTSRFDRWLSRQEVSELSRADFVEGAPEAAAKRVEFASQMFGTIPGEIFTCAMQPQHSRRHRNITPQERALLQSIGQKLAQSEGEQAGAVAEAQVQAAAPTGDAAGSEAMGRAAGNTGAADKDGGVPGGEPGAAGSGAI